ncbi:MAG: tetratricopeptide repeat protein [Planctomycetes bacterium]|nr:tetratricopeptide repeat protein [Planctomycetota bacterium]
MTSLFLSFALAAPSVLAGDLEEAKDFLAKGWFDDAAKAFQQLIDEGAGDATELEQYLAEAQIGAGDVDAALEILEALPESYRTKLLLGRTYAIWAEQLAYDNASADDVRFTRLDGVSHYKRAVELAPPGDSEAVVALGYLQLFGLGDYKAALELAETYLAKRPDDAELLLLRGNALVFDWYYKAQGDDELAADDAWNQAVDDLKSADAKLGKGRVEALNQLIYLYQAKDRALDAVNAAVQIVERQDDPDLGQLYELAKQYSYARQFAAGAKALETIVKLNASDLRRRIRREDDPDDVALNLHWSTSVYTNRNDNATARMILEAIVAADPAAPDIWDNYAVACQTTGQFDDAIKAYDKKIALFPDDPRTYNDKAKILEENLNRDSSETIPLYEKAVAMCEEQLKDPEIDAAWKAHLEETQRVARGNLDALKPAPSLLDSVLDRLKNAGDKAGDEGGDSGGDSGN